WEKRKAQLSSAVEMRNPFLSCKISRDVGKRFLLALAGFCIFWCSHKGAICATQILNDLESASYNLRFQIKSWPLKCFACSARVPNLTKSNLFEANDYETFAPDTLLGFLCCRSYGGRRYSSRWCRHRHS